MSDFVINGRSLTLSGNPTDCTYSVKLADKLWTMSEKPFIIFSDDSKVFFPAPDSEEAYKLGTAEGIKAVYSNFGEHKITVTTKAELEVLTDDIYFTLIVEGDEKCEIKRVSFPAPFDFGEGYGDKGDLTDKNIPLCYTVLSRMQGCLVPAGKHICLSDGKVYERDSYMPIFGQVRENTGYLAVYDTPYDVMYELRYENGGEKVCSRAEIILFTQIFNGVTLFLDRVIGGRFALNVDFLGLYFKGLLVFGGEYNRTRYNNRRANVKLCNLVVVFNFFAFKTI